MNEYKPSASDGKTDDVDIPNADTIAVFKKGDIETSSRSEEQFYQRMLAYHNKTNANTQ